MELQYASSDIMGKKDVIWYSLHTKRRMFMGYKKPVISEIAYRTFTINEFGMATCFVL